MEFAEWKKQVEGDYLKWIAKKKISLSRKEDGNIIGYFDAMCNEYPFLQIIYDAFHSKYGECKKGVKTSGEKTIKMLFIKAVIQDKIRIEKNKEITVEIDKTWIESETDAQDGIYDNVYRDGYFPMGSSSDETWIDFCSAFHRLIPNLFNSWDKVNDFCVKCCKNEQRDNFLCARDLEDICTFYSIVNDQNAEYKKNSIQIVTQYIIAKLSEAKERLKANAESFSIEPKTAYTLEMQDDFTSHFCGMTRKDFCEKMLQYSLRHSIWSPNEKEGMEVETHDRLTNLTAIQDTYEMLYGASSEVCGHSKTDIAEQQLSLIYEYFDRNINGDKLNEYIGSILRLPDDAFDLRRLVISCFIPCLKEGKLKQRFSEDLTGLLSEALFSILSGDGQDFRLRQCITESQYLCFKQKLKICLIKELRKFLPKKTDMDANDFCSQLYKNADGKLTQKLCNLLSLELNRNSCSFIKLEEEAFIESLSTNLLNELMKSTMAKRICSVLSKYLIDNMINKSHKLEKNPYVSKQQILIWSNELNEFLSQMLYDILPQANNFLAFYNDDFLQENISIRYFAVLAAMIKSQGEPEGIDDLRELVNEFLRECYVRELDEESYDDFDWFVYEAWKYEKKKGTLKESCGVNTIVSYLQNK